MLRKFSSLSLTAQSMSLIALLVLGEVFFVALLSWQLLLAEQEISRESHLKDVLRNSQKLVFLLSDYEQSVENWAKSQDPEIEAQSNDYELAIKKTSTWLTNNTKDLNLKNHIEKMKVLQGKVFRIVHKSKERLRKIESKTQAMAFVGAVFNHVLKLRRDWEFCSVNLLNDAESLLKTYPEIEANRRKHLETICWVGVSCNIILVLVLSAYFIRTILSRLITMTDNTRRLTAKQPMNPVVAGSDEIAKLDLAMHEMADAIEVAQKERQAFLAMVSHELRTPLNSIRGTIEILTMGIAGPINERSNETLLKSDKTLEELLSVINDLLDLEKMEAGKLNLDRKTSYLEFCISKAAATLKELAEAKDLRIVENETNAELSIDADRITQLIRILVCNAIQHSKAGSEVQIEAIENDTEVTVRVIDSGPGVPEEMRKQLFERFRKMPGSDETIAKGMGLPIARKIAEAHEGKIGFIDNPEGGSTFFFTLPKHINTMAIKTT